MSNTEPFPTRYYRAPFTGPGNIKFVNITPSVKSPQGWICTACFERVTLAFHAAHATNHR